MLHPDTRIRYINDEIGYGIFATKTIPLGTVVYVKDSLEFEIREQDLNKHHPQLKDQIEKYTYTDERGIMVMSWDFAKYVNHCCNSNTLSTAYGFDIAVRDIEEGEEMTCDYGMLNVEKSMPLQCNQSNCRNILQASDFETCYKLWDHKVIAALDPFLTVKQPLSTIMDPLNLEAVTRYLKKQSPYKSVSHLK